jgi:glycosyltransferase involved in cell wall biosynthesis
MKKIAVMPVKNEEWILEYTLTCASKYFDHIIVADQFSTDRTPEICKKFEKVIYIKNNNTEYDEGDRRQLLLNEARKIDGNNFIANIAADEIFTANIIGDKAFEHLIKNSTPGTSFSFQWVQLWKSPKFYRDDNSVWSNLYRPFAFIDDRKTNYKPGFTHLSIVPEDLVESAITIDDIKVLHYQFVEYERLLMKQRWARLLEFGSYKQPDFLKSIILNNKYFITKDERNIKLKEIPTEWVSTYPQYSTHLANSPTWHVETSINFINEYGKDRLKWLDIWDYSWPNNLKDQRNYIQKIYHRNQHIVYTISELIPKSLKKLIKKI